IWLGWRERPYPWAHAAVVGCSTSARRTSVRTRKIANRHTSDPEQEQPSRARRTLLTGGAVGLAAVAGTTFGRVQPASAGTANIIEVTPTVPADPTGVADTKAIVNAIKTRVTSGTGGVIYLAPGVFYITFVTNFSSNGAAISVPAQTSPDTTGGQGVSIQGSGSATVVKLVGGYTGSAFYCHRTDGYGQQF